MEEDISEQHRAWFTPGVRGIGLASLLSDLGHEVPTSLLPRFVASTLGGSAALGVIEGIAGRCRNRVRHSAPPQVGGEGATTDPPAVRPVMKGRLGKLMSSSGTGTPRRSSSTVSTLATYRERSLQRSPWFTARSSAR
jgi:hypothetical protein